MNERITTGEAVWAMIVGALVMALGVIIGAMAASSDVEVVQPPAPTHIPSECMR